MVLRLRQHKTEQNITTDILVQSLLTTLDQETM